MDKYPILQAMSKEEAFRLLDIQGEFRKTQMKERYWNEETGLWWWEQHPDVKLRIVAACNRWKDVYFVAARHSSIIMTQQQLMYGGLKVLHEYAGDDHEQGFIDQYENFHSREEAVIIAKNNNQLYRAELENRLVTKYLFSEDLY